jgi:diguanylate cyclase (GGDEF)-like protein
MDSGTTPRRWLRTSARQMAVVVAMAVAMLALAAFLGRPLLAAATVAPSPVLPWWALALGFAATEATVFHLQLRREARTVSISELPLVLGLFLASPLHLLIGRLAGSAAIFFLYRRSSVLKSVWNLAMISLQTTVAVAVFQLIGRGRGPDSLPAWLGGYAGPIAANWVACLALALVIAVYEGDLRLRPIVQNMISGDPAAPLVITVGLVAVISLSAAPRSAVLLLVIGTGLLLAYRAYAALSDRHLTTERLYRFTQAVTRSPEVDELLGNVLGQASELLRAERAEIAFVAISGGDVARIRLGATGRLGRSTGSPAHADQWLLKHVVNDGSPMLMARGTRDADQRRWLEGQAARDAVVVPLRGGAGILGALIVTDRLGDVRSFDDDDVLLLEAVANQASVALQNGELLDQLRHESVHDALTGLPNRSFLQSSLTAALEEVANGRSPGVAVMILDLNGFKDVNDTLGHQQGDGLLVQVGARLRDAVGDSGVVARLGGDEFAVLLAGASDEDAAVGVGRRLLRVLEQPIALDGLDIEVGASLGLALAPRHGSDPSGLLKRADMAMYEAKASVGGLRVFETDADVDNPRRLLLVSELRAALHRGRVDVHVQPQARLVDGETVSVEALARWHHPELGFVTPDEFIPVAERSGLIGPLTSQVLDTSLAAVAEWRRSGADLAIAVNLSTRSLHDGRLVEEVVRLLRRHDVPASRLTLEVTEGSVMADPARATAVLHELRDLGVRLSVDDFGTGYSSLSYLKKLPVHEVKIDRSFITGLTLQGEDAAIVRAIVDLGRHLGLEVVAEGVEDQQTWDLLASMGCHLVQGWHLSRPMPIDHLLGWLRPDDAVDGLRPAVTATVV